MSEKDLIKGCRAENRLAQKALYQKYYGKMLNIPMRYTRSQNEAIDVLNRAFLKVFQNIKKYKEGSLSGWIATIVLNTSIDYVRQQNKYRQVMDFEVEKEDSFDPEIIENLYAEDLFNLIQELPTNARAVFSLSVIEGFKHREIAEKLGISVGTSKWYLAEAKKELKKKIEIIEKTENRRVKIAARDYNL